jgi:hypothetical protein
MDTYVKPVIGLKDISSENLLDEPISMYDGDGEGDQLDNVNPFDQANDQQIKVKNVWQSESD